MRQKYGEYNYTNSYSNKIKLSTEAVENSWNILNAISGHKYQNQTKACAVLVVVEQ